MKRIIGDFLDLGALREGRLVLDRAAFDLHTLVAQSIEHNSVYAARKAIRLALETGTSQAIVQGDGARITQVIDNLVSNAIKFTPNGGAVLLRIDDQLPGVRIEVRDTGPGLTKDDLAGLFVPHRRGASRPTGNESSTGLGLALCKQLVELHGGHIGAQNATEGGAVFWFELPRG
jgi:signal transduction histidine kinase